MRGSRVVCSAFCLALLGWSAGADIAAAQSLPQLLSEADVHNPEILAARSAWQAARQVPSQVSTLPDPQVELQSFSVGGPLPYQGFSTSNFAYIGLGVTEDLPYPGKLRLRGQIASQQAAALEQDYHAVERRVAAQVETEYYRLGYLHQVQITLQADQKLLHEIEQVAEARYTQGSGNEQDVLKAQLNETKIVDQLATNQQDVGSAQALLKAILNRLPQSPDLAVGPLQETPLPESQSELLALARTQNPAVKAWQASALARSSQVKLAHKDFYPDFSISYMYQRTDPSRYRAYYMLTFGVKLPIFRARRQEPELAEAVAQRAQAQQQQQAATQQSGGAVQAAYVHVQTGTRVLRIYKQGLIPQAQATFQAGLAAYQTGREDFETLLNAFLDLQNLNLEYWSTLAQRETALAQIEQLTPLSLH